MKKIILFFIPLVFLLSTCKEDELLTTGINRVEISFVSPSIDEPRFLVNEKIEFTAKAYDPTGDEVKVDVKDFDFFNGKDEKLDGNFIVHSLKGEYQVYAIYRKRNIKSNILNYTVIKDEQDNELAPEPIVLDAEDSELVSSEEELQYRICKGKYPGPEAGPSA